MSATFISDLSNTETQSATTKLITQIEIELSKCECCGLTEECTPAYIKRVRERYLDHWICGLCAEAIKYEILRSSSDQSLIISTEEAIANHMNFFKKFKTSVPPPDPTLLLISALRQILRRSTLNSPTSALRSTPTKIDREICSPGLTSSDNCFPTFST